MECNFRIQIISFEPILITAIKQRIFNHGKLVLNILLKEASQYLWLASSHSNYFIENNTVA